MVAEERSGSETRWILRPWPASEVMRTAFRLDEAWVEALAAAEEESRRDWVHDGVLRYRGRAYRLGGLEMLGSGWRYRFERIDDEAVGPPLRLTESNRRPEAADRDRPPSVIRTTLVTAAICMSPRSYQERWAQHLGVRAVWFTLLGAGAELVGGWINLEHGSGDGGSSTLAVNLFFLVEAVTRLALLVSTGRPVGSVLGWAARPLLARMMPEGGDERMRG